MAAIFSSSLSPISGSDSSSTFRIASSFLYPISGLIVSAGTGYPASSKLTRNASITLSSSFTEVPAISNTTSFISIILFYVRLIFFHLQQVAKCHLTKSFYVFSFHEYFVCLPFVIPVADLQTGFHHAVAL